MQTVPNGFLCTVISKEALNNFVWGDLNLKTISKNLVRGQHLIFNGLFCSWYSEHSFTEEPDPSLSNTRKFCCFLCVLALCQQMLKQHPGNFVHVCYVSAQDWWGQVMCRKQKCCGFNVQSYCMNCCHLDWWSSLYLKWQWELRDTLELSGNLHSFHLSCISGVETSQDSPSGLHVGWRFASFSRDQHIHYWWFFCCIWQQMFWLAFFHSRSSAGCLPEAVWLSLNVL